MVDKIGNFVRPEDSPWHSLSVEGFGVFNVQAETEEMAWLKLTYATQDTHSFMNFNPEQQLAGFQAAEVVSPDEALALNYVHRGGSIVVKRYYEDLRNDDRLASLQAGNLYVNNVFGLPDVTKEQKAFRPAA